MCVIHMPLGVTATILPERNFDEQLVFCMWLGLTHYSLRPSVISDVQRNELYSNWGNHKFNLTPRRLIAEAKLIRQKLDDVGITPFGTLPTAIIEVGDDELKEHFEGAAAVGIGRVRVSLPSYPSRHFDCAALLDSIVDA